MTEIQFDLDQVISANRMALTSLKNNKVLLHLVELLKSSDNGYLKINNNRSFMPLTLEYIEYGEDYKDLSIAHYGKQEGDLMADPEVILRHYENGDICPFYYLNHYAHCEYNVRNRNDVIGLIQFLDMWLLNIKEQQF